VRHPSVRAIGAAVALLLMALGVFGELRAQTSRPLFRTGVDIVSLSVTVTDASQRYITDLDREDFVVLEEGVPQRMTFFRKTEVPLALALLIDSSASMEQALATAQEAAIGFARQLGPSDVATVIDFDSRVQVLADFTNDVAVLEGAVRRTAAGGSTSLYNAIYIALRELGRIRLEDEHGELRRRVIVVLSDGEDTSSLVSFDEVLDVASRSDAVIYTIGLGVSEPAGRRSFSDAQFILRRLAQQTGGRAFFPQAPKELAGVYRDIRNELSTQYLIAYESSAARNGEWRRVSVRVNRPNVTVRTRQGYFAPRQAANR
jgi:Ca-activated chloride channel family protein